MVWLMAKDWITEDALNDAPLIVMVLLENNPIPPTEVALNCHCEGEGTIWRLSGMGVLKDENPSNAEVMVWLTGEPHTVGEIDCPDRFTHVQVPFPYS